MSTGIAFSKTGRAVNNDSPKTVAPVVIISRENCIPPVFIYW